MSLTRPRLRPSSPSLSTQAENDAQLVALWLHGRSVSTQEATSVTSPGPFVRRRLWTRWPNPSVPEAKIHEMIALTPEGRDRMLLRLLYATGARVSEICALNWRHIQVNGESGQITLFGKGRKTHAVVLRGHALS